MHVRKSMGSDDAITGGEGRMTKKDYDPRIRRLEYKVLDLEKEINRIFGILRDKGE